MSPLVDRGAGVAFPEQRVNLRTQYQAVRRFSAKLCEPLAIEDYVIQSMPDASPTRWHLAHTTWFFETFVLKRFMPNYQPGNDQFEYLFNSYYNAVGNQFARPLRGLLSRPTVAEVMTYRQLIDAQMLELLDSSVAQDQARLWDIVELGIHHEQQHQELMLTDIKHLLSCNPLFPSYVTQLQNRIEEGPGSGKRSDEDELICQCKSVAEPGGVVQVGAADGQFAFDNERPRHAVLLRPYRLQARLITNGQYLEFIEDEGYRRPELWLSLGWQAIQRERWEAPLYWYKTSGTWQHFTLSGLRPIDWDSPVCHVSLFEADAYARWRGQRLPQEAEWEVMARELAIAGNFVECGWFEPRPVGVAARNLSSANGPTTWLRQMYGDVWEWTASPYIAYPGFTPAAGALGEYNGKFMCNQYVLRGGSCASPASHLRATYRNFFPPEARWQFTGIRLAEDDA
ncbi:MAG: ergothioneine biosynthesis protein EgtB [Pirellulaceae bacterium]|nr:ergothioneine biosynthesis protein EgtB [Pirellulaceae bacterium]